MKIKLVYIFIILGAGVLLFIYGIFERYPHLDDAWIGEQVYWLNKTGTVKNVLMKNYANNQEGLLTFHKVVIYNGLIAVKLFGFHLNVLRSISLFYLIGFFGVFYFYLVKVKEILSTRQYLILLPFLLIEPHIFEYAFVFRPEILLMSTGFISYIFLEKSLEDKNRKIRNVVITSLFTGLGILVHLNGLIFVIAAGLFFLLKRRYRSLLIFIPINFGFVFLYFSHIDSWDSILLWFNQLMSYETGSSNVGFSWNFFTNIAFKLLDEQRRFLHSPKEIFLTILFLGSLIIGFKNIVRRLPLLLPYFMVLVLILGLLAPSKTSKYMIPLLPYMTLVILLTVHNLWRSIGKTHILIRKNWKSITVFITMILFVVVSSIYNITESANKFTTDEHHQLTQEFVKTPTNETTILAPMIFIYDEINNFKEIVGLMSFNERAKTNKTIKGGGFLRIAQDEGIDYIFINDHYINEFGLQEIINSDIDDDYKVVGVRNGFTILESKQISSN